MNLQKKKVGLHDFSILGELCLEGKQTCQKMYLLITFEQFDLKLNHLAS